MSRYVAVAPLTGREHLTLGDIEQLVSKAREEGFHWTAEFRCEWQVDFLRMRAVVTEAPE